MKCVYARPLTDEELRPHLERGDSITFNGLAGAWEEIENQVERLGFGDTYGVYRTKKPGTAGEERFVKVVPLHLQQKGVSP